MNKAEFFKTLDSKLGQTVEAEQKSDVAKRTMRERFNELIDTDFERVVRSYERELEARRFKVEVESSAGEIKALKIRLHYVDGGISEATFMWSDDKGGGARVFRIHTNDDGRKFSTDAGIPGFQTPGSAYAAHLGVPNVYTEGWLEELLQTVIEEHRFYADRHGGIRVF